MFATISSIAALVCCLSSDRNMIFYVRRHREPDTLVSRKPIIINECCYLRDAGRVKNILDKMLYLDAMERVLSAINLRIRGNLALEFQRRD